MQIRAEEQEDEDKKGISLMGSKTISAKQEPQEIVLLPNFKQFLKMCNELDFRRGDLLKLFLQRLAADSSPLPLLFRVLQLCPTPSQPFTIPTLSSHCSAFSSYLQPPISISPLKLATCCFVRNILKDKYPLCFVI